MNTEETITRLDRWFNKSYFNINSINKVSDGFGRYYTEETLYSKYVEVMNSVNLEFVNFNLFIVWLRSKYNVIDPKVLKTLNDKGQSLHEIRKRSRRYLFHILGQEKLPNYEVHHCFTYNDYHKFIYVPVELHREIHKRLRELKIDPKSNHYEQIEDLIKNTDKFVYISK